MHCLDERKLKEYLSGSLPAGEIVPTSEHVRSCADCRAKVAKLSGYQKATAELAAFATASQDCPEYETLSAYAGEELVGVELMNVERHITNCELCARDVETLQAVRSRASLAPSVTVAPGAFTRRSAWTIFGWRSTAVATFGAAAVAAAFILSSPSGVHKPAAPVVAQVDKTHVTAPAQAPSGPKKPANTVVAANPEQKPEQVKPNTAPDKPVVHQTPKPERIALLNDGGVTVEKVGDEVRVTSDGSKLESIVRSSVEQKLKHGKLPADMQMAKLDPDMVRGPMDVVQIQKISPEPGKIASDKPLFEWQPVENAERYRVQVSRADGTPVLYEETTANRLQTQKALPGGYYKWTVWTRMGEYAAWNPSKAVWFKVLTKSENDLLTSAKAHYGDSHLVMGTVYEKLGMKDDAVREFQSLARENPNSKLAQKMLAGTK